MLLRFLLYVLKDNMLQKDVENYKTLKYSDITKEKTGGLHSIGENNRILNLFRYIKIRLNPCYM